MTSDISPPSIEAIIAAIQLLAPDERRQLQRRLRVSGLFVPEDAITDQDKLHVAPAIGVEQVRALNAPAPPAPAPPTPVAPTPSGNAYRTPVSGKVVIGAPTERANANDPHTMQPLPGQAPEQPIQIIFDGGSRGNPGQGYGSYALRWPGSPEQKIRLQFGNQVTNNEAEYDTLIAALEGVIKRLRDSGADPATARLDVRGDSLLVINQVLGKWQAKEERLQVRRDRIRQLLKAFGGWQLHHHGRANSVEVLGH
jgi:ribonuclease HI